ncbi:MAG TPA: S8 family serine peptidase, partial [Casimicrobiaceae bacterium]|nr:S8 family serine peptidase [Casimicrobiaceae bacterium]
ASPALAADVARVIVALKSESTVEKVALASPNAVAKARADMLSKRLGVPITAGSEISRRVQVITAQGITSEALAQRLAADPNVEFAVPDRRKKAYVAPNDPLYSAGISGNGPAAGQWYLRAPAGEIVSSIDAERAWNITQGSPGIVVAVLDTGVRFDHPDLLTVGEGGNFLPGYDMISDGDAANDGDGRDPDASDPGDWLTEDEVTHSGGRFEDCEDAAKPSSWHGTKVAGIIGALTNNGVGIASVGRTVRILPVRVLGKCGGFDSDIIAGMRWAAGLPVPGVPANPTPARVINLSLGGESSCNSAYRNAVADVIAAGAVIVASAGNSAGHRVSEPGNCSGVIAVAALRHVGTKVGFSDLGPEITLAAPGGNCVNIAPGSACLYPIATTSNLGAQTPGESSYTTSFAISVGTSFAAPLVSGTVALMLSARSTLTPAQVKSILQGTTRPFPATSSDATVGRCTPPRFDAMGRPIDQLECLCTTDTCGAGMLDAGAAVTAASAGVQRATVVEFYNTALDHYFITWIPSEIAALDAGTTVRGWVRTNEAFTTYSTPEAGTSPVCRFYIPPTLGDSHFFGRGLAECEATGRNQVMLVLEDARFMHLFLPVAGVCPAASVPVYRVFSARADANHRYTTSRAIRDQMRARGWLAEGDGPDLVVMCAPN